MTLTEEEIISLLVDSKNQHQLFKKADQVRQENVGNSVLLRGLIEFSNSCKNNCLYCGLRKDNIQLKRYNLSQEDVLCLVKNAVQLGLKTIVFQSGENFVYSCDKLCRIIEQTKKFGVAVTLSIGEKSYQEYKAFRDSGADRYLMRIETTDQKVYHDLNPGMSWQHRYECLQMIKELGYELGSGIMVGLPRQTLKSIARDLLFLKKLKIDMAGIGPFIPHPCTPLSDCKAGTLDLALRTMAIMRILLPHINIPATTAMENINKNGQLKALQSGANVIMLNATDSLHRSLYEIYPSDKSYYDTLSDNYFDLKWKIYAIGRKIDG